MRGGARKQAVSRRGGGLEAWRAGRCRGAEGGFWRPTGLFPWRLRQREAPRCAPGPLWGHGRGNSRKTVRPGPHSAGASLPAGGTARGDKRESGRAVQPRGGVRSP
ncbi:hypothetical protein NDU88_007586 [Pleurodeles waltl]|uniref:Uncharacterized protein n=1 Tax=Pleurodeles waltl TaxID=8319 RepID=A0AAV7PUE0_PLEWA|nr:hypothetical protein NDU88_007586 [Pleurodeles waltl]